MAMVIWLFPPNPRAVRLTDKRPYAFGAGVRT
jgi:hypothetical protein